MAAGSRGLTSGDVVRVFNDRGACLAAVDTDDGMLADVVMLPTGAWYKPAEPGGSQQPGAEREPECSDVGRWHLQPGPGSQCQYLPGGGRIVSRVGACNDTPALHG